MTALHLLPDAPISSPGFDRLDRMPFVRSFAEAIRAVKGTDSVVLALAGPWGSGKSSLLNLIAGELEKTSGDHPPLVMRFNPWWFSGTGQLVAAFLQQLAATLSRPEVEKQLGKATLALDCLSQAIGHPGELEREREVAERDIERLQRNVHDILRRSDRRILIFMDDIDRLTPDEMTQLLLIVRAVATFPNTTYVLAFDHEVVSEAITEKLGVDGRTYLEKVVQLQIDVPIPGRMTLQRMVIGQLEAIDPSSNELDAESQTYFRLLFNQGVKHFLVTPRACTRLLNVLRFTYPTLTGQVYFPDMLGVSCLMSFSSQAIQAIRSNSDAFVGHCDPSGKDWIQIRRFHKEWLSALPKKDRPAVESIVRLLFPKVAWALNGPLLGEEHLAQWHRQKRICSPKHFEAYFRLGLSAGEAAEYQWHNIVELLDDATAFARSLQRFGALEEGQGEEWIDDLLRQADEFIHDKATSDQAAQVFRAIMRRGDEIAAVTGDVGQQWKTGPFHSAISLLVDCLLKIEPPPRRAEVLEESVKRDAGLLTAAEFLELTQYRLDALADQDEIPDAKSKNEKLKELIRFLDRRIQAACENGELTKHPLFMRVIQKWYQFGRKKRSQQWLLATCASDKRFVQALQQLAPGTRPNEPHDSIGGDTLFPLAFLTEMFGRKQLVKRCAGLLLEQPDWLTDHGEAVLTQVATAIDDHAV